VACALAASSAATPAQSQNEHLVRSATITELPALTAASRSAWIRSAFAMSISAGNATIAHLPLAGASC
jgi:hypothetical protein